VAVELDGAAPSLADILRRERAADDDVLKRSLLRAMAAGRLHGEVLVREFRLSPSVVNGALRRQLTSRLAVLESLADARVAFRVTVRPPRGALHEEPLGAPEFLYGRRRARERSAPPRDDDEPKPQRWTGAWRVLGLVPGTSAEEIKRAYRRLARSVHPDTHPDATDDERRALEVRFAEITEAYRALVA
jgi:DnaJ-domain-containing protein 1